MDYNLPLMYFEDAFSILVMIQT